MNEQQYFTNQTCELHLTWISPPSHTPKKKTEHKKHLFVYHVYHPFHIPNSNFTQKQHPHPHPLPFLYILPPHGLAIKPSTLTRGPPVLLQQKKKNATKHGKSPRFRFSTLHRSKGRKSVKDISREPKSLSKPSKSTSSSVRCRWTSRTPFRLGRVF